MNENNAEINPKNGKCHKMLASVLIGHQIIQNNY